MDKRVTPGKYVSTGTTHNDWHCDACGFEGSTATGKAPDGERGLWCYKCAEKGVKSPLRTVQVSDLQWVRGTVEVKCCGVWLECDGFTNTCNLCGADYNHAGQRLAPRGSCHFREKPAASRWSFSR